MELSIIVLIILVSLFLILVIGRKYYVNSLLKLKQEHHLEEYFRRLESPMAKIFVQKINRLYLKLNGYKQIKDNEKVDQIINEMLKLKMNALQKEDFYFHQCHYYILRNEQTYIDIFLQHLKELDNLAYYKIAVYANDVIRNERNDLIDEIDQSIEELKGNNLGIACYLIALQYLRLKVLPQAKLYFQSAAVVTMNCVYDALTKAHLADLSNVTAAAPKE